MQEISRYLSELAAIQSGVSFSDLGIRERAESSHPYIIASENKAGQKQSVSVIPMRGVMRLESGLSTPSVRDISTAIETANKNPEIKAIILHANTGGGEALAGQEVYNAVKSSQKPVLVYADYLGSAGVLAASPAAEIWAAGEMSQIGSIGVMTSIDNRVLAFYKENVTDLYSEKSPDKNGEYRELMNGNPTPLINRLTKLDDIFMAIVSENRDLKGTAAQISETLAGGMFTAKDAIGRGLIDNIGTMQDAVKRALELSNTQNSSMNLLTTIKGTSLWAAIFGSAEIAENETATATEKVEAFMSDFQKMKTDMASLQTQFSELKAENETLKAENLKMKTDFEAQITAALTEKTAAQLRIAALEASEKTLNTQLADMQNQKSPHVSGSLIDGEKLEKSVIGILKGNFNLKD